uniref:F-box domain-containing protein n=1 Tax=Oryza barthii TaxID=65489 RepID=A0A0D3GS95_9ORYZ
MDSPLPALTDELLEEIFFRIGSPADLARASSAYVSFRRLIAGRHFLRCYHSVYHPPLLLGFVHLGGFEPAQPPHPSAPVARALAAAADFPTTPKPAPHRSEAHVFKIVRFWKYISVFELDFKLVCFWNYKRSRIRKSLLKNSTC